MEELKGGAYPCEDTDKSNRRVKATLSNSMFTIFRESFFSYSPHPPTSVVFRLGLVSVLTAYIFFAGGIHFNFTPIADILITNKTFEWLCMEQSSILPEAATDIRDAPIDGGTKFEMENSKFSSIMSELVENEFGATSTELFTAAASPTPSFQTETVNYDNFVGTYQPTESRNVVRARCAAQDLAISRLFTIMQAGEYGFAIIAGSLLDLLGPKLCGVMGLSMSIIGWSFFGMASQTFRVHEIASLLMGASVEFTIYPILCTAHLFPRHGSIVLSIFGTARSLSFFIPVIMRIFVVDTHKLDISNLMNIYSYGCLGFCLVVATLLLPLNTYPKPGKGYKADDSSRASCDMSDNQSGLDQLFAFPLGQIDTPNILMELQLHTGPQWLQKVDANTTVGSVGLQDLHSTVRCIMDEKKATKNQGEITSHETSSDINDWQHFNVTEMVSLRPFAIESANSLGKPPDWSEEGFELRLYKDDWLPEGMRQMVSNCAVEPTNGMFANAMCGERLEENTPQSDLSEIIQVVGIANAFGRRVSFHELLKKAKLSWKSFISELLTIKVVLVCILYVITVLNVIFFIPSAPHLLPSAYKIYQLASPLSFLPCPIFGLMADKIGILFVMHVVNMAGLASYIMVQIPGVPAYTSCQYIACFMFAVQTSFMSTQIYCYANFYFSDENMGRLLGVRSVLAGVCSLLTNPMRSYALKYGFHQLCYINTGFGVVNIIILCVLQIVKKRQNWDADAKARSKYVTTRGKHSKTDGAM